MVRTSRTSPVCLVHLVYPVSLVKANKQDRPEGLADSLGELGRADEAVSLELCAKNFCAKRS
jgi:hypothetical protein